MIPGISFALALLAFSLQALGEDGDMCFLTGVKTSIVNDRLYFLGGNYLWKDNGNVTVPRSYLYHIELNSEFPVEMAIPSSSLQTESVEGDIAYGNAWRDSAVVHEGAIWTVNGTIYLFGGEPPSNMDRVPTYEAQTNEWDEFKVSGGKFNYLRQAASYATAPEAGLGFILGGDRLLTWGMIRFNASDLSWTNETLGNGSFGAQVPNLGGGALVYIPAGPQGMLVAFGGANLGENYDNISGGLPKADWKTVHIYDIASHTWWMQPASGESPSETRSYFGTAVTMSPDGAAFHITTYGGWGLYEQRAYEDVYILSLPSFVWINATSTTYRTNLEQRANWQLGRRAIYGSTQTYRGSQMIVLGGQIYDGNSNVALTCGTSIPAVRVLDLSTYEWRINLDPKSAYAVPPIIYNRIGGDSNGGATKTVPAAGFADPTLSSLLFERVSTSTTLLPSPTTASESATPTHITESNSQNTGAIAGGVVGGVASLVALLAICWWVMKYRRKQQQARETDAFPSSKEAPRPGELGGESVPELGGSGGGTPYLERAELHGYDKRVHELP